MCAARSDGSDRFALESGDRPDVLKLSWQAFLNGARLEVRHKINDLRATSKQLHELREHFNLQVENPCVVLTQVS